MTKELKDFFANSDKEPEVDLTTAKLVVASLECQQCGERVSAGRVKNGKLIWFCTQEHKSSINWSFE